jgi:hypothetical protein
MLIKFNFLVVALAALVPLVTGFIWYNPKVFGTSWIKSTGLAEEELKKSNMAVIFGLTYVCSFLIAAGLMPMVIHQFGYSSILQGEPDFMKPGSEVTVMATEFMAKYGDRFRTFGHGALHGTLVGLFFATPIIGILALFERKSFKYVMIHAGYYAITMAIMGGILCKFA